MVGSHQTRLLGSLALAAIFAWAWRRCGDMSRSGAQHIARRLAFSFHERIAGDHPRRAGSVRHMTRARGDLDEHVSDSRWPGCHRPLTPSATLVYLSPPRVLDRDGMVVSRLRLLGHAHRGGGVVFGSRSKLAGPRIFRDYDCQTRGRLRILRPARICADRPPEDEQFANVPFEGCDVTTNRISTIMAGRNGSGRIFDLSYCRREIVADRLGEAIDPADRDRGRTRFSCAWPAECHKLVSAIASRIKSGPHVGFACIFHRRPGEPGRTLCKSRPNAQPRVYRLPYRKRRSRHCRRLAARVISTSIG